MLLRNIREVLGLMAQEPGLAADLPRIKRRVRITAALTLLTELVFLMQLMPLKFFVDEIARSEPRTAHLALIVAGFLVVYKLSNVLGKWLSINRNDFFWSMFMLWWSFGNRAILRQSTDWHVCNSTGEKDSLVGKNISRFESLFDTFLFVTAPVVIRIGLTTIFVFLIHWSFGVVALLISFVYGGFIRRTELRLQPARQEFQERMKELESFGSELTRTWQTSRSMGIEERLADENEHLLRRFWHDEWSRHMTYVKYIFRQDDVLTAGRVLVYATAGVLAVAGHVGIGSIVLATSWLEKSLSNYLRLAEFQRELNVGKAALVELIEFLRLTPTVRQPDKPVKLDRPRGDLEFNEVCFGYDDADGHHAVCNINLQVPANTSVALVGSSGCGKSTLVTLLGRGYDPTSGSVSFDGVDLRDADYLQLRQRLLAQVSQNVVLFDRSILDNIRIGRPDATFEQVIQAARDADAHEFILDTPDGYHSLIGENGLRLSGGQRQRLAIARALLMQPSVLTLDEATSSLDAISQAEVQATLDQLMRERRCTLVIIAHRLSTIRQADMVVVMDGGQIVDRGSHDELLERCEHYQQLCRLELGAF